MKILNYLKIENFLGTEKRDINFWDFDSPLFIVGENAWGKTTIMRAVFFALTGEDAFFGSKNIDSLINDNANKMSVELSINNKWNVYIININKERGKTMHILISENWNDLIWNKLVKDAKLILQSLFWNALSMLNTYFLFWNTNTSDFVNATPVERLNKIVKISDNFKRYDEISENAKLMVSKIEIEKNNVLSNIKYLLDKTEEDKSNLKVLKEKQENILKKKEGIKDTNLLLINNIKLENINLLFSYKNDIDSKKELLNKLSNINIEDVKKQLKENEKNKKDNLEKQEKINKLKDEKENIINDKNKILLEKNNINNNISSKNNLIKEKNKYIKILSQEELEILNLFKNKKNNLTEDYISTLNSQLKEVENNWLTFKSEILNRDNKIKNLTEEIEELNKKIKNTEELFSHNESCPLCHSVLTQDSLKNYKEYLKKDITEKNKSIKTIEIEKEKINEEITKLRIEYNNIKEELKKTSICISLKEQQEKNNILNKEIIELNKEIEELSKKEDLLKENLLKVEENLKQQEEKINSIKLNTLLSLVEENKLLKIIEDNKNIDNIIKAVEELKLKIEKEFAKIFLEITEEEILNFKTEIENINKFEEVVNNSIDKLNESITKNQNDKENFDKKVEELNKDIKEYSELREYFGKNWVQKQQIQVLLKQIELETNWLVKKFFENLTVKFVYDKKWIDLKINRIVYGKDWSVKFKEDELKNFSDAQQEVLTVLLKLSFSKVVQHLNNIPLNILFLNETFNTLSKDKEAELLNMLNTYNRDYHLVFITHNLDLVSNFWHNNTYNI